MAFSRGIDGTNESRETNERLPFFNTFISANARPSPSVKDSAMARSPTWNLWKQALTHGGVWRRSLIVGLTVGAIQVLVNQGDHWLHGRVDGTLVVKTLITPLIGLSVALFSCAGAFVELQLRALQTAD